MGGNERASNREAKSTTSSRSGWIKAIKTVKDFLEGLSRYPRSVIHHMHGCLMTLSFDLYGHLPSLPILEGVVQENE